MSSKIVTLSGNMGSGKDTVAGYIKELIPEAKSYAFADHLKQIAIEVFECTIEEVYGDNKEVDFEEPRHFTDREMEAIHLWVKSRNPVYNDVICLKKAQDLSVKKSWEFKTPRALMQFLGTELLRDCYSKEYHINQVAHRIEEDKPSVAVVTDARFPNERDWAKDNNATLMLVTGRTREDFDKENFNKHESETGLGDPTEYDVVIDNFKDLPYLKELTKLAVDSISLTNLT